MTIEPLDVVLAIYLLIGLYALGYAVRVDEQHPPDRRAFDGSWLEDYLVALILVFGWLPPIVFMFAQRLYLNLRNRKG